MRFYKGKRILTMIAMTGKNGKSKPKKNEYIQAILDRHFDMTSS